MTLQQASLKLLGQKVLLARLCRLLTPRRRLIILSMPSNAVCGVAPSPKAQPVEKLIDYIHAGLKVGEDPDLVQMVPPGVKEKAQALMDGCDMIVCTGSQNNVNQAQTAGTPEVAVGTGNVTVIVDETADLVAAAKKIKASNVSIILRHAVENAVVVVDAVYDAFVAAIGEVGGALVDDEAGIIKNLWPDGHLNRHAIAQDAEKMIALSLDVPEGTDFVVVPPQVLALTIPFGRKIKSCAGALRAVDFDAAVMTMFKCIKGLVILLGFLSDDARAYKLANTIPTSRVIVNQAHTFATGVRSLMVCRFRYPWGVGHGAAIQLMKTSI